MKFLISSLVLFLSLSDDLKSQNVIKDPILHKWLQASVNIEGRPANGREDKKLWDLMVENKISSDEYHQKSSELRKIKWTLPGTAIYFRYNNVSYLLTAGHVIEDTTSFDDRMGPMAFSSIALVNSVRDFDKIGTVNDSPLLSHLNTGPKNYHPYIIWKERDLGVISLSNSIGKRFEATLNQRGYKPIELSDIDTLCKVLPGDNIKAIGFPHDLSIVAIRDSNSFYLNRESRYITKPIVSNGFINSIQNDFFSADIFIYIGNSGGPIIKGGKLVGIVSNFYSFPKTEGEIEYYDRYVGIIKSSYIMQMVRSLENRMKNNQF